MNQSISVIAHNIRSSHNVGSLLRTCEGLGINMVYLSGYTPYPLATHDTRLPHIARKVHAQIQKTALGAEQQLRWQHINDIKNLITDLKRQKVLIAALEQAIDSQPLPNFTPPKKLAILLGNEVEGIDQDLLSMVDVVLEIPMFGRKESFNVIEAASMALYHCRFQ